MKPLFRSFLDSLFYLFVFLVIQLMCNLAGSFIWVDFSHNAVGMIIASGVAALLTIIVFAWRRWVPVDRSFLQSKPWILLCWTIILTLGTLIPSLWLEECIGVDMPEQFKQVFEQMMSRPEGYLLIGILTPVAEEMVFRGAVLKSLLHHSAWLAIIVSSLLFGLVHGNLAQGTHAFVLGILLGWLYVRTGSIVPGIVLHWVNNTVAYVVCHTLPQWNDAELKDIFGSDMHALMAVGFSLLILLPALFQVGQLTRHRQ